MKRKRRSGRKQRRVEVVDSAHAAASRRVPGATPSNDWPMLVLVVLVHVATAVLFLTDRTPGPDAARSGFPLDDAWIHMVYGRSVAQHGLPYFNHGEVEAGFTSPVWVGVLAVGHGLAWLLRGDPVLVVKLLGVLGCAAISIGIYTLVRTLTDDRLAALAGAVLSAASPILAFTQLSGMEPGLCAALGVWSLVAFVRARWWTSGVLVAGAVVTRPESVLLWGLLLAGALRLPLGARDVHRRAVFVRLGLPALVALSVWSMFCLKVTGHPLPNTFYAKLDTTQSQSMLGLFRAVLMAMPANQWFAGFVLMALGALSIRRLRSRGASSAAFAGFAAFMYPWIFLYAVGATRTMPEISGTYFYWLRYTVPALPFCFISMALGIWGVRAGLLGTSRLPERARAALALGLVVPALVPYPAALRARKEAFAWNSQNINEVQVAFGNWVADKAPEDAAVLVNDPGAIRYFGGRRTIDLFGLNASELLFRTPFAQRIRSQPEALAEFMTQERGEYLIIFQSWFPNLVRNVAFGERFDHLLQLGSEHYTVAGGTQSYMDAYRLRSEGALPQRE